MSDRISEALKHIERNGNLVYMPNLSRAEAEYLFRKMKEGGFIERHTWTDEWILVNA